MGNFSNYWDLTTLFTKIGNKIKAVAGSIPTKLSDLTDDATHRTVTDTEKSTWNNKTDLTTVTIPAFTPSQAGWRRICKIKAISGATAEGMIYAGGNWSNGQPPSACIAVNIMHTNASLTLLSSARRDGGKITAMRLINDAASVYWLDVYFPEYPASTGPFSFKLTGDIAVSDIQNPISITTDSTAATDEISLNQNVHGTVLTDTGYINADHVRNLRQDSFSVIFESNIKSKAYSFSFAANAKSSSSIQLLSAVWAGEIYFFSANTDAVQGFFLGNTGDTNSFEIRGGSGFFVVPSTGDGYALNVYAVTDYPNTYANTRRCIISLFRMNPS